jgi:hypothetical protein
VPGLVVFPLALVGAIVYYALKTKDPWKEILSPWNLCFVPIAGAILIASWLSLRSGQRRTIEKTVSENKEQGILGECYVALSPESFFSACPLGEVNTRWSLLRRIELVDDRAFFFFSDEGAVILPQRAFADTAAFADFVETAGRYQRDAAAQRSDMTKGPEAGNPAAKD